MRNVRKVVIIKVWWKNDNPFHKYYRCFPQASGHNAAVPPPS